jgi:hypothetical protein
MATAKEARDWAHSTLRGIGDSLYTSLLGMPIGDYPHSRPPQAELPEEGRAQIRTAYQRFGLIAE